MITTKRVALICALAFVFGCSGNKVKDDQSNMTSANIGNEPMSSGPEGSDSGKIDGLNTIHFDYDQSTLRKQDMEILKQNVIWIKKHPETKMQIEGHCDEHGSAEYNLALGERRANAVSRYLVAMGIKKSRLSTISYGKERPLDNGGTEEAYAKNRRANFVPLNMGQKASPLAGAN